MVSKPEYSYLISRLERYDHEYTGMIKEKENNTKATINGDKEGLLETESFVDTEPSEPGEGGALPQNFGK